MNILSHPADKDQKLYSNTVLRNVVCYAWELLSCERIQVAAAMAMTGTRILFYTVFFFFPFLDSYIHYAFNGSLSEGLWLPDP